MTTASGTNGDRLVPRVLIVSERGVVRAGLCQVFESAPDFQVCGAADGFESAIALFERLDQQVAILDLSLRNGLGLGFVRQVKKTHPRVRVIATSLHEGAFYAGQVLAAGAEGYLDGQAPTETFLEAVRTVARGNIYLSPNLAQQMLCQQAGGRLDQSMDPLATLTQRELQVFELLGEGLTTKRIARQLELSAHTVETYRERIRHKINAQDGADLTFRAIVWRLLNS